MKNSTSPLTGRSRTQMKDVTRYLKRLLLTMAIVFFGFGLSFAQINPNQIFDYNHTQTFDPSGNASEVDRVIGNPYIKGVNQIVRRGANNPDLPADITCGDLRVVLILDESGSISPGQTPGAAAAVRSGALQLAQSLLNSGAQLRVVEFATTSSILNLGGAIVNPSFISNFNNYLNSSYSGQSYDPISASPCTGWTNWEAALKDAKGLPADLVIFFTDGNPTAYDVNGADCGNVRTPNSGSFSYTTALNRAITQADLIKNSGKHMFAVGVGSVNTANLIDISGSDNFAISENIYTDDYSIGNFEDLADALGDAVNQICGTEITIDKTVSPNPVCPESSVTFTITVENTGGSYDFDAINTVLTDAFPAGFSNFAIVGAPVSGASISGSTLTYNIGDLVADIPVTIQVTANAPPSGGTYTNTASANADNANLVTDDAILQVSNITGSKTTETVCDEYLWSVNQVNYNASAFVIVESTNNAGCIQRDTLDLTVNYSEETSFAASACDSYTWDGTTYGTSGVYTKSYTNVVDCDSTSTLNLTINNSSSSYTEITACDSYEWMGVTYTEGGLKIVTGTNAAGCVQTDSLQLTINNSSSSYAEATACDSYEWMGTVYTEGGLKIITGTNAAGCVQTDSLDLTINNSSSSYAEATACDSYEWMGIVYTEGGLKIITGTNAAGCVQTDSLDLTINNSSSSYAEATACDSYEWMGTVYTEGGLKIITGTNAAGCVQTDSLDLTINNSSSSYAEATACDSYEWMGIVYTEGGLKIITGTNAAGCVQTDSLDLTINNSSSSYAEATACDSYEWMGETYTEGGLKIATSENAFGCVQTDSLLLTINYSESSYEAVAECDSYDWMGMTYTESGLYINTGETAAGCAKVDSLQLTINGSLSSYTEVTECNSFEWNGEEYNVSGLYINNGETPNGCAIVDSLQLTINYASSSYNEATACDSYEWMGETYTEGG
ncbi:DUF11 domain-containing protein, partial [Cryomorpha ignava]|nr:DUF11 domain-containing protein [Cryomorpha ignava]